MPSVGAVTSNLNVTTKTGPYTAAANDFVMVNATAGPVTITLPTAPVTNTLVAVKKIDTTNNLVTVSAGSSFIDSDTSVGLFSTGSAATMQYDGTRWRLQSTGVANVVAPGAVIPAGGTSGQVLTKASGNNYDTSWSAAPNDLPVGGAAGQVLQKNTGTNYDTGWTTLAGLPAGGTAGQVLTKTSATNYAASWSAPAPLTGSALWSWRKGESYNTPPRVGAPTLTTGFSASTAYTFFFPIQVPNACTITQMQFQAYSNVPQDWTCYLYSDLPGAASLGPNVMLASQTLPMSNVMTSQTLPWNYALSSAGLIWLGFYVPSGTFYGMCVPTASTLFTWTKLKNGQTCIIYGAGGTPPATLANTACTWSSGLSGLHFDIQVTVA